MRTLRTLAAISVALVVLGSGGVAWGHAAYKSSDPADGETVSSPPSRVTAEFTEPLAGGSELRVTDPCGRRVDNGDVTMSGFTMSVTMDGAATGRYVVYFRAHSQLDPHVVEGDFTFTVSSGESCPGASEQPPGEPGDDPGEGGAGSGGPQGSDGGAAASSASGGRGGATTAERDDEPREAARARSRGSDRRPGEQGARVPNIAAPEEQAGDRRERVWDGIRLESFLTGLLLAAIIGAAGGKIYAGIMGPRA